MIAIDSSTWIAYFSNQIAPDVEATQLAINQHRATIPPLALTELLSDPQLPTGIREIIKSIPLLPQRQGYWERAGLLRSRLLKAKRKAKTADTLIAQACIDANVALITRDRDYKNFVKFGKLRLALA